jgi:hypothetical protein
MELPRFVHLPFLNRINQISVPINNSSLDILTLKVETPHYLEMSGMATEPLWRPENLQMNPVYILTVSFF